MTTIYKGAKISKRDEFGRYTVSGVRAWGDQPCEDSYRFKTVKRAKEFIDRMAEETK